MEKNKGEFMYLANGEEVRLSPYTVRKYLVSGDADKVTEQEIMMFLTLCKYQHLNPFLREAYLIKFGSTPATIVTGKDVFTKRAAKNPRYMGKDSGIIINRDGVLEYREGTLLLPNEQLVGGWARIYVKDRQPEMYAVSFSEYAGRKRDGSLNSNWAIRPATMIRKVAVVQGLRECFPEDFEGMYSPEEMSLANKDVDVNEIVGEDDAPIVIDSSVKEVGESEIIDIPTGDPREPKKPTDKQIQYAKYLAHRASINLPDDNTFEAYSAFIDKYSEMARHEDAEMNSEFNGTHKE